MSTRGKARWWTTSEERILIACMPHCTYAEISRYLGRTVKSVRSHVEMKGWSGVERGIGHKVGRRKGDPRLKMFCPTGSVGRPMGSHVTTSNGVMVKVGKGKWKRKAVILWEASGRTIPTGHILVHIDRVRTNCDLSNLMVITRGQNVLRNQENIDKAKRYAKSSATRIRRERYRRATAVYVEPFIKSIDRAA